MKWIKFKCKLPILILENLKNLFELRNKQWSSDGPLKKNTSKHF